MLLVHASSQPLVRAATLAREKTVGVRSLSALISLICLDQPHLAAPPTPSALSACLSQAVGVPGSSSKHCSYTCTSLGTLLIWTLIHRLTSWLDLGPALPLWTCLMTWTVLNLAAVPVPALLSLLR